MGLTIIIGGDIVPSFRNIEYFQYPDDYAIADNDCMRLLDNADFRIYNLETPITDKLCPIDKDGANFAVASNSIKGIKKLNPNIITVANNHCKDHGKDGLENTIDILKQENINPIGYGFSHKDSEDITFLQKNGIKIAVVACAEKEFTIFENGEIGAVPYHDYWTNKHIADAKKNSDVVLVLYHGGTEYYQYVPPYLRERCRLMAENGADYIFCQHSHCIGCYEEYGESTIVYGQGNFIFHQKNNKPITKEGLLIKLNIDNKKHHIDYIPVVLNEADQICLASDSVKDRILREFKERSQYIEDENFVKEKYNILAMERAGNYFSRLQGNNKFFKLIIKIMNKLGIKQYNKKSYIAILNLLQNENHRELFIRDLKMKISDEKEE